MADAARARKVADRIKVVIAANLEQVVKDPDLGFVTITDVRVTGDLQQASVFYTVLGDEAQRATTAALLEKRKGRLRSLVGRELGIRLTPTLDFHLDAVPETAAQIDDLLRQARERDAAVAAAAAGARYAGEADPYRHDEEGEEEFDAVPDGVGAANEAAEADGAGAGNEPAGADGARTANQAAEPAAGPTDASSR
ncbi:Ribosome-binding factor A (modular protein) [Nostocoides japonicum T1-X7]|uniref:Ribosome-binding factor A n=1 Tax=Nostocoides japonicum T1-X7 TaxID=1194083 RepID=A0A077M0Y0_9MICO|nr:30S ribosome-binding factor RbfA [Tetrasphaera japonica]CCH77865.1 Ribosome-binding factor A (modular protein) [Tetrasphaera japonica T1-X7]